MKHVIEFNLPDDQEILEVHLQARRVKEALGEFLEYLRGVRKYSEIKPTSDEIETTLYDTLKAYEVRTEL